MDFIFQMNSESIFSLKKSFRMEIFRLMCFFFSGALGTFFFTPTSVKAQEEASDSSVRAMTVIITAEDIASDRPVNARFAHGVVISAQEDTYTLITAAHVIERLGCLQKACTVRPILAPGSFRIRPSQLSPGSSNDSIDIHIASFEDPAGTYVPAFPDNFSQTLPAEGAVIQIVGVLNDTREITVIRGQVLDKLKYNELYSKCPGDLTRDGFLIYELLEENANRIVRIPPGLSGGPIVNSDNELVGIQIGAGYFSLVLGREKCSQTGNGTALTSIIRSGILDSSSSEIRNEFLAVTGNDLINEDHGENMPYVMRLRRERMSDPGRGSSDDR